MSETGLKPSGSAWRSELNVQTELHISKFQVLFRFLPYLCRSRDDLPAHSERVCSTGRHPVVGCNVALDTQQ